MNEKRKADADRAKKDQEREEKAKREKAKREKEKPKKKRWVVFWAFIHYSESLTNFERLEYRLL